MATGSALTRAQPSVAPGPTTRAESVAARVRSQANRRLCCGRLGPAVRLGLRAEASAEWFAHLARANLGVIPASRRAESEGYPTRRPECAPSAHCV